MLKVQSSLSLSDKVVKSGRAHTGSATSSNKSLVVAKPQSLQLQKTLAGDFHVLMNEFAILSVQVSALCFNKKVTWSNFFHT